MTRSLSRRRSVRARTGIVVLLAASAVLAASRRASAQFTEVNPGLPTTAFPCLVAGDYDGDGDGDVLLAGTGKKDVAFSTLYRNDGGTFVDSGIALLGLGRASAAWGDFDGDGDLDLAMTGQTTALVPTTRVYRNDGNAFAAVAGSFANVFAGSVAWADYDGDGDLDLLITGVTSAAPGAAAATRLYRNDAGAFTPVSHPFPDCYLGSVAWADYDGDGDLDVLIDGTDSFGGLSAALWRNSGGTFSDSGINLPGNDLGVAESADFDRDGDQDLLFGGNSNAGFIMNVYRNDGGAFVDSAAGLLPVIWSSAGSCDYDRDGNPDLMIIGYDPVAQVKRSILYHNDGGAFSDSGVAFHDLFLGAVQWIDYDLDGDFDLLLAGNDVGKEFTGIARNDVPASPWVDLGHPLAGSSGLPRLKGTGPLTASSPLTITLDHARANALTYLVLGMNEVDLPFLGGVLVPNPLVVQSLGFTDASGTIALPATWPAGVPAGVSFATQAWMVDPGGKLGFAASNGLAGTSH